MLEMAKQTGGEFAKGLTETAEPTTLHPEILEITAENINRLTAEHLFTIVFFYVPWNGMCQKVVPEFFKMAEKLKMDTHWLGRIQAGKLNCERYPGVCEKYEIA